MNETVGKFRVLENSKLNLVLFTGIDYTVRVELKRDCYMVLYKEFVENDRDYLSYEDLKKNFKINQRLFRCKTQCLDYCQEYLGKRVAVRISRQEEQKT